MTSVTDKPAIDNDAYRTLGNGKLVAFGRWLLGVVVATMLAYFANEQRTSDRLTRVETAQEKTEQELLRRLDRIENKLDRIER
jgi:hypothetical protein